MKYLLTVLTLVMVTGCSTISGAGKDITNAAEWTKEKMSKTDKKTQ